LSPLAPLAHHSLHSHLDDTASFAGSSYCDSAAESFADSSVYHAPGAYGEEGEGGEGDGGEYDDQQYDERDRDDEEEGDEYEESDEYEDSEGYDEDDGVDEGDGGDGYEGLEEYEYEVGSSVCDMSGCNSSLAAAPSLAVSVSCVGSSAIGSVVEHYPYPYPPGGGSVVSVSSGNDLKERHYPQTHHHRLQSHEQLRVQRREWQERNGRSADRPSREHKDAANRSVDSRSRSGNSISSNNSNRSHSRGSTTYLGGGVGGGGGGDAEQDATAFGYKRPAPTGPATAVPLAHLQGSGGGDRSVGGGSGDGGGEEGVVHTAVSAFLRFLPSFE
jgi:hypothetical protein